MNPEFRRNIWIEMTLPRLMLAVFLPSILILAAWLRPNRDLVFINTGSLALYWVAAVIWGARRAANSVGSEVRGRTWEGQVMSSLTAWSMTWGKLIGGCALVWLAGFVCLASSFAVEVQVFPLETAVLNLGLRLFIGFAAQAIALCSALIILRKSAANQSLNSTLSQSVGIIGAALFGMLFAPTTTQFDWLWTIALSQLLPVDFAVEWYGINARTETFRLASLVVFFGWTWLAANRLMRHVLQYSNLPWAWAAFVLFMITYVGGFFTGPDTPIAAWLAAAFLVTAWLIYPASLSDVKDPIAYGWLRRDLLAGRWRLALQRFPAWIPSLLILLILGLGVAMTSPFSSWGIGEADSIEAFVAKLAEGRWMSTSLMLAVVLFVIRDIGVIHMLAFSDAGRYSDVVAFLVLIVLYLVVPIAGLAAGAPELVAAFLPSDLDNPAVTLLPVAAEAILTTIGAVAMARKAAKPPKPATATQIAAA